MASKKLVALVVVALVVVALVVVALVVVALVVVLIVDSVALVVHLRKLIGICNISGYRSPYLPL